MNQSGLAALADTYGLDRTELRQLEVLGERFFDQLREELGRYVALPVRLADLGQLVTTFAEFVAASPAQHHMVVGIDGQPALCVRIDGRLAGSIVAAMLGYDSAQAGATDPQPLTKTERRMLSGVLERIVIAALARSIGSIVGEQRTFRIARPLSESGETPELLGPGEQLVCTAATCRIGAEAGSAAIGIALPLIFHLRDKLQHPQAPSNRADPIAKARASLHDSELTLRAVLGSVSIALGDLRRLGPGSFIPIKPLDGGVAKVELRHRDFVLFAGTVVEDRGWHRFVVRN
jgi:flagellar motor switch protein FliM